MEENLSYKNTLKYFVMTLGAIIVIGLIMVYSSSYMYAKEVYGSSIYYVLRQCLYFFISLGVCIFVAKTKYNFWYKFSYHLNIAASFILTLTFVPGLGNVAKGANRWIRLGPLSFQPGEIVKYTTLLAAIYFFENFSLLDQKKRIKYAISLCYPMVILLLQPDFGTFSICFTVVAFACFLSSFPRKWFYSFISSGLVVGLILLVSQPYRVKRLLAFMDPWKNAQGSGFQVIQSWIGFANGGFFGKGPGNSIEKLFYLPEAHNDFIFSVIGEELGFIGVFFIICLYVSLIYFGFRIAVKSTSKISYLIITSLVFTIGLQTLLNMGVVLGLLPTKGLNLPFISYGGSSLLANFFAIGLIISASRNRDQRHSEEVPSPDQFDVHSEFRDRMRLQGVRKEA